MANIEALKQLRRVVLAAREAQFDMALFGKRTTCGTVCCAAGWAALDPWFLVNTEIGKVLPIKPATAATGGLFENHQLFDVDFSSCTPIDGLAGVFGIGQEDACALFNGETVDGVTKQEVIDNIDRLLAGSHAEPYPEDRDFEED